MQLFNAVAAVGCSLAIAQGLAEHRDHDKHGGADPDTRNIRNGIRPKTVLTESSGQVQVEVPRDRAARFEPQICASGSGG